MQHFVTFLRLVATTLITVGLSSPATAKPPLITSGMNAAVGRSGWYTSNVTIHTATFVAPDILATAADIQVEQEGRNEVSIPDGLDGNATQIVNIDKKAPEVSIADLYVRGDGATILSVTVSDPVSGPATLDVSLDNGTTWQSYSVENGYSSPEWVCNLEVDHSLLTVSQPHILARAVDVAGNISAVATYAGAEK